MKENAIGTIVVDCALHLLPALGPGLLETVYEVTLSRRLDRFHQNKAGFSFVQATGSQASPPESGARPPHSIWATQS